MAADVCRCLGMNIDAGVSHHLPRLSVDERRLACRKAPTLRHSTNNPLLLTEGGGFDWRKGEAHTTIVSESGLYKLIMRSDKAAARPFQDWVTKDVLPAVRKTGGYVLNEEARAKAHADNRAEAPLPPEFAAAFAAFKTELTEIMKSELSGMAAINQDQNSASLCPVAHSKDD